MVAYLFAEKSRYAEISARLLLFSSAALLAFGFILRWVYYYKSMGKNIFLSFPVTNFYESVTFCIFCLMLSYIVFEYNIKFIRCGWAAALISGTGILFLDVSGVSSKTVLFVPALQSYWLIAHVLLSFIGYAFFGIAALIGGYILVKGDKLRRGCHGLVGAIKSFLIKGMFLFTIGGLLFGAVWAQSAWGRFWSWDPKETWAFITWCVYLVFLHAVQRYRLSPKAVALFAVMSFFVVIFTFLGINLLFSGLHSYGSL